jgi:fatty-acyl-CoA synthase
MTSSSLILQIAASWQSAGSAIRLRVCDATGNPVFIATGDDLLTLAGRYAAGMAAQGVRRGDNVALVMPTSEALIGTLFGALWLGAAVAPLAPPLPRLPLERELERIGRAVKQAEARLVVTASPFDVPGLPLVCAADLVGSDVRRTPEDPGPLSVLQFSSGSTGHPKGVALPDDAILANLRSMRGLVAFQPGDVTVSWVPLHHDMGLFGSLLLPNLCGVPSVILPPEAFILDPARWLHALSDHGGTHTTAPSLAFQICARLNAQRLPDVNLSRVRVATIGGEPVRASSLRAFAAAMAPLGFRAAALTPTFGLAEATLAVTGQRREGPLQTDRIDLTVYRSDGRAVPAGVDVPEGQTLELTSLGTPVSDTTVSIRDPEGIPVPDRTVGEVWVQSASLMAGYINDPEASARALTPDGWLRTGDLGYLAEGELYLSGRAKDLIIRTGAKYHPEDLEPLVEAHPAVRTGGAAIVVADAGQPGRERALLLAEIRPGALTPGLGHDLRQALHAASGLRVDEVVLLKPQQLPKTTSGKIRRQEACRRFVAGELALADG